MAPMTRYRLAVAFLLICVAAAPFFKSLLQRRGVSTPLAYLGGFALLALAVIVVRVARA
jgi:hypothetical protein